MASLIASVAQKCHTIKWCSNVDGKSFCIDDPDIIPTCIGAAIIGIYCGRRILRTENNGSSVFSLSFFMYAVMMTSAMIIHCFGVDISPLSQELVGIVDTGLTSCIALNFMFCALVDLGWINEHSIATILSQVSGFALIFFAYYKAMGMKNYEHIFFYLYFVLILITCGFFCIVEGWLLLRARLPPHPTKWVIVAGASGFVGLVSAFYLSNWLCDHFSSWFGGMFVWFVLSDVAMIALYKYYMTRGDIVDLIDDDDESDGNDYSSLGRSSYRYTHVPQDEWGRRPQPRHDLPLTYPRAATSGVYPSMGTR